MKWSPLILILLALCSCATRSEWLKLCQSYRTTYHEQPPRYFWRGPAATNGQAVLHGIRSGDAQSQARVRALIGSSVVFIADCDAPTKGRRGGVFSDLQTRDGIEIEVDIIPFQDVRPKEPCGMWVAEVMGTLESVDFEKRVIRIATPPKDFKIVATY